LVILGMAATRTHNLKVSQPQQGNLRIPYPGINARVTAPFLLVIIVIAGLGVFIVTRLVAGSIQERFNNQLVDSATAASNSIVDIERQQLATLRMMVFTEGVAEALAARDAANLDLWLRPIAANAGVDDVVLFDSTGQSVFQLSRVDNNISVEYITPLPINVSQWEGVQRVIGGQADSLGDKFVDVIGEPPDALLYISAPMSNDTGTLVGGISLGLTAERLAQRVSEQSLSAVTLFRDDGRVLGTTLRVATTDSLNLTGNHATQLLTEVDDSSPIDDLALNGIPHQVLYSSLQLRSQEIGLLAVALPSNFIVERSSTSRDVFGILFSIVFVLVGLIGIATARSITRPIAKLVDTTRAIREGDLSKRVELETPDELGELGVSFDHMTNQLVERNKKINKLYRQQLQETARRQAVLTSISDAVVVLDPSGNIILQNLTAEHLASMLANDLAAFQSYAELIQNPAELSQPRTVTFADQFFSVLATPVCMPNGELLGYVTVFRDITALVTSERLKDELILQMSHELRTPLAAARGYVDLVRMIDSNNLSEQSHSYMDNATESMSILERMVNQVVDVSSIVSDRFKVEIETFNLAHVLDEQVESWKPLTQKRELALTLFRPSSDLWIEGDPHRLAQVLEHLLRNAYSYTLPGGMIEVRAEIQGKQVLVSVLDSGVGIGQDEIDRVFERMYRGRSADAGPTDARGLGLGLYLSKRIVEGHHGKITLESQLNFGTIVTVELPLRQAVLRA
jgi:signal transduction histidine kinase